jgi:hypothetical protein
MEEKTKQPAEILDQQSVATIDPQERPISHRQLQRGVRARFQTTNSVVVLAALGVIILAVVSIVLQLVAWVVLT